MPDMPCDEVVDPHIHLFDLRGTPRPMQPLGKIFGWNDRILRFMATKLMPNDTVEFFGRNTDLLGDYLPVHYRSDSASSKVSKYVHIQAGWTDKNPLDPVGETVWLSQIGDGPAAIVGYANLELGADVESVLDAHLDASDRFRGVRHMLSWHPSPEVMNFADSETISRKQKFREGYDQLAAKGLSFDAWGYSDQLGEIAELAAYNTEVPMVLCHAGTPVGYFGPFGGVGVSKQERDQIASKWSEGISELAAQSQVRCKLSGLLMPVLGLGYQLDDGTFPTRGELVDRLGPIVTHCIREFGPERCMVASNFPVDRVAASYADVTAAMVELTTEFGQAAQQAMFRDSAASFYQID